MTATASGTSKPLFSPSSPASHDHAASAASLFFSVPESSSPAATSAQMLSFATTAATTLALSSATAASAGSASFLASAAATPSGFSAAPLVVASLDAGASTAPASQPPQPAASSAALVNRSSHPSPFAVPGVFEGSLSALASLSATPAVLPAPAASSTALRLAPATSITAALAPAVFASPSAALASLPPATTAPPPWPHFPFSFAPSSQALDASLPPLLAPPMPPAIMPRQLQTEPELPATSDRPHSPVASSGRNCGDARSGDGGRGQQSLQQPPAPASASTLSMFPSSPLQMFQGTSPLSALTFSPGGTWAFMSPDATRQFADAAAANCSHTPIVWQSGAQPLSTLGAPPMIDPVALQQALSRLREQDLPQPDPPALSQPNQVQQPASAVGVQPPGFPAPTFVRRAQQDGSSFAVPGVFKDAVAPPAGFSSMSTVARATTETFLPQHPVSAPSAPPISPIAMQGFATPQGIRSPLASELSTLPPIKLFSASNQSRGAVAQNFYSPLTVNSNFNNSTLSRAPQQEEQTRSDVLNRLQREELSSTSSASSLASTVADHLLAAMGLQPASAAKSSDTPPPGPAPFARSALQQPSTLLLSKARDIRRAFAEGPASRSRGSRLAMQDGSDAELTLPLGLVEDMDLLIRQRLLDAAAVNLCLDSSPGSRPPEGARRGVSEVAFEAAWNKAAADLSQVISEATGADSSEILRALGNHDADASIALLSLLHERGDAFQQACAHAAAVELQKRRKERSLARIVEDAARQGSLPRDLSCKRVLRNLQSHLPLTEIMGHRYRTDPKLNRVDFDDNTERSTKTRSGSRRARAHSDQKSDDTDEGDDRSDSNDESSDDDDDTYTTGSDTVGTSDDRTDDDDSGSSSESESPDSDRKSSRKRGKSPSDKKGSNLVATPPPNWDDGDPPKAGFYLETFTDIYSKFRSFTRLHKGTGLRFKDLIQDGLRDTVMMELGISSTKKYNELSEEDLIQRIKSNLGFTEDDYYVRKLELLKLLPFKDATTMQRSFRKLTTPFLRIMREAKDSGVHLRFANVSRIFKQQIQGSPALTRWFQSKRFTSFSAAIKHVSAQIHERMAKQIEMHHDDLICDGKVAGVRSDIRGGKSEAGQASPHERPGNPNKRSREQSRPPVGNRIDPNSSKGSAAGTAPRGGGAHPQRSPREEAAFQEAMKIERALPRGMYHHPQGPFCKETPCKAKICQGCNYHADADGRGHIRPNCKCKDHPLFVQTGYFHEKHPGRTGALSLSRSPNSTEQTRTAPPPARLRFATGARREDGDQA